MDNKNIKFSISYITNFKPADFTSFKNLKLFKNKNDSKVVSRNFFLFLILLKHINTNQTMNTVIFVKPNFKKMITLLRAPYRYKLARHQFVLSRYYVLFSFNFYFKPIFFKSNQHIISFVKLIKNFYVWFESNIVYQHQIKIFIRFFFKNNFIL